MPEITDDELAVIAAGALASMVVHEHFPIELDPDTAPYQDGEASAFIFTTKSGLLYRVGVDLIGQKR